MPLLPVGERERRLLFARIATVSALGIIGQIAVDAPDGIFGGRDQVTTSGTLYAVGILLLAGLAVLALRRGSVRAVWIAPLLFSANVGIFLPMLVSDPVMPGIVIVWNLALLARHFSPPPPRASWARRPAETPFEKWLESTGPALRHVATASSLLSVAVIGYRLSDHFMAIGTCLALSYASALISLPLIRSLLARRVRGAVLMLVPLAAGILLVTRPTAMIFVMVIFQAAVLVALMSQTPLTMEALRHFYTNPSRLVVVSFISLILLGTLLLTFPGASSTGRAISPLDALFTATSATCVTGLIVLDTPRDFSATGQVIVLGLIQIGGLGIMTLSTFSALILGGALGLRGEQALTEVLNLQAAPTAYRLTKFIVLSTLAVEAAGALVLTVVFLSQGFMPLDALWRGVFHAVSAFCNAGFALQSDSLLAFRGAPGALLTFAGLIVLGGSGFVVLSAIGRHLVARRRGPLDVQVRIVMWVTAILICSGTALYCACEWNHTLEGLPLIDKLTNGLFQSVTLRTAGFNSVSLAALAPGSMIFMLLFMFIGGSPGGTAGGIKTSTAAVLLAALRSAVKGEGAVKLLDREIPDEIVKRSLAIVVISALLVAFGTFLLSVVEDQSFDRLLFEATSAFGTVGLTLGATAGLTAAGKLIIIGMMFIGRVGPLTIALLLGTGRTRVPLVRYPKAQVMVG